MLEDNVIDVLANDLRARGGAILAEGGNQMRAFRFITASGRRKAPDLVVYLHGVLTIFEAKVDPLALFRRSIGGPSDFEVISQIANDANLQDTLIHEAKTRLAACGQGGAVPTIVCAGLIASGSIVTAYPNAARTGLVLVNVDMVSKTYCTETTVAPWTQCLQH